MLTPATFNWNITNGAPAGISTDLGSSGNLQDYKNIDSGFPHSTDVDNPEWIRNSAPFLPGPRKTTIKQLRLERDGYSNIIIIGSFV